MCCHDLLQGVFPIRDWTRISYISYICRRVGFPCGSTGKESSCNAGDLGSIPGLGGAPGEGKGYPLQYSGLENSMHCIVHGVTKSLTRLSDFHFALPLGPPGKPVRADGQDSVMRNKDDSILISSSCVVSKTVINWCSNRVWQFGGSAAFFRTCKLQGEGFCKHNHQRGDSIESKEKMWIIALAELGDRKANLVTDMRS